MLLAIVLATIFSDRAWIVVITKPLVFLLLTAIRRYLDGHRSRADPQVARRDAAPTGSQAPRARPGRAHLEVPRLRRSSPGEPDERRTVVLAPGNRADLRL